MSKYQLVVALRFEQENLKTNSSQLEQMTAIMGKAPDDLEIDEDDGTVDYFSYDPEKNNKFTLNLSKNVFFVDYLFNEDCEYGVDLDIEQSDIDNVVQQAAAQGFKTDRFKLKILYFYNGGSSGLSETI